MDFTGPLEVLARLPQARIVLAASTPVELAADCGRVFANIRPLTEVSGCALLCVPGGGVTAGIDMALAVVAEVAGTEHAQVVQLGIEYAPDSPFGAGRPETAPAAVVAAVRQRVERIWPERLAASQRAAAALEGDFALAAPSDTLSFP